MKTVKQLIEGLEIAGATGDLDVPVSSVCYDSRQAGKGSLFVCIRGTHADGHDFIDDAVSRGAVAIVAQAGIPAGPSTGFVRVRDPRAALAAISANYYDHPAAGLDLVGITGTNGKTTTSLLIESILRCNGSNPGVLGTLAYRWGGNDIPSPMTTPESLDLQRIFSSMLGAGVTHVVMEVSSHALALGRIAGCTFRTGVFTNLSQDHLDFHTTMEQYFAAKRLLFSSHLDPRFSSAVINEDDDYGRRIIENGASAAKIIRYSCRAPSCAERIESGAGCFENGPNSVFVKEVRFSPGGIAAKVQTPLGVIRVDSPLMGRLNLYNIVAAVSAAVSLDIAPGAVEEGVRVLSHVDGRLERAPVPARSGFQVIVDYAHTPDGMEKALACLREMTENRLIAVFGCGGDRDRGKRPIMGRVGAELADVVIITSDNPRTERPDDILDEIEEGVKRTGTSALRPDEGPSASRGYIREGDRRKAIELALSLARPGDVVFIGGKGHETYQIVGTRRYSFDDRLVVKEYFEGIEGSIESGTGMCTCMNRRGLA
jgi:UDP-N-acetylmuramoyl-L-alanyl-D-glutamate--2,6-diaminopimelate ligase